MQSTEQRSLFNGLACLPVSTQVLLVCPCCRQGGAGLALVSPCSSSACSCLLGFARCLAQLLLLSVSCSSVSCSLALSVFCLSVFCFECLLLLNIFLECVGWGCRSVYGVSKCRECRVSECRVCLDTPLTLLDTVRGGPLSRWLDTGLTLVSECRTQCQLTGV